MKIYSSDILFFSPLQDDDTSEQQGEELVNARGAYDTTGTPKPPPPKPKRVGFFDPFVYC